MNFFFFGLAILGTQPGKCSDKSTKMMPKDGTKSKKIVGVGVIFGVLGTLGRLLGPFGPKSVFRIEKHGSLYPPPPQPEAKIGERYIRHRAEYQGALSKDVGGTLMSFCVKCSGTLPAKCILRSPGMRGPLSILFFSTVFGGSGYSACERCTRIL